MSHSLEPERSSGDDQKDDRLLITPPEAAACMSISLRTLWTVTRTQGLPHVRIGRSVRYAPGDLAAWIERHKTVNRAEARHTGPAGLTPPTDECKSKEDE